MNSLNSNSEPIIGTRRQWGIASCWILVIIVSLITAKGCNDTNNDNTPLFISKQK